MTYNRPYYPKRPVKSFQDLEVYQKLLAVSVAVTKRLAPAVIPNNSGHSRPDRESICIDSHFRGNDNTLSREDDITLKLAATVLNLPLLIAEAHSLRFSEPETAIRKLERVMLGCNQAVVYLEQYRDIKNKDIESDFFAEQIKTLLATRGQVMRLQFSWKKFLAIKQKEQDV